jgi:carboxymethylenebutenolidase
MCHEPGSSPPIAPVAGGAVEHHHLVLNSADGTMFSAFEALGQSPSGAAVVVMPDVRGLHPFYEELALRLAEHGYDAVAIDYFGRTTALGPRDEAFDHWSHVQHATIEGITSDVAAAVAHLRATDAARPVFTIGFCFGGSTSWHQAASGHGLTGAIGFYGHPDHPDFPTGARAVVERIADIECPILGLMGGDDPGIPIEVADRFRDALDAAGIVNDIVVYPGAPHSFFDRKAADFAEASADAWERVLAFLAANG